jgi:tetratricopeptide (TPR) repeat protein
LITRTTLLALVCLSLMASTVCHAQDALQTARKLLAEGKIAEAETAFATATADPHLAPEAYYTWYRALRDRGRDDEALTKLQAAADLASDRADWWLELGNYLSQMARHDEALSRFASAICIDPRFVAARLALAAELVRREDTEQALIQVREVTRLNPNKPQDWVTIIELSKEIQDPRAALATGISARDRWPQDAGIRAAIGHVYEKLGEPTQALAEYQAAAVAAPKSPLPHLEIGRICYRKGDPKGAEAAYRKVVTIDKTCLPGWLGLAWAAAARSDAVLCREYAEVALKLKPGAPDAVAARGWSTVLAGKKRDGRKELEAAAKAVPPSADALYCLAQIARQDGQTNQVKKLLRRTADAGPGIGPAWRAPQELRELEAAEAAPG